jgi:predicted RNase H-like HicB family nuclease
MNVRDTSERQGVSPIATEHSMIDGYRVVYEQPPRNWSAYSPDVPGCMATGQDRQDVERVMREAIAFYFEPDEEAPVHPERA